MDCSPPGSSVHGNSPGMNTGLGCQALLQGIFPTQRSNPGFLHCRQILYWLSLEGRWQYTALMYSFTNLKPVFVPFLVPATVLTVVSWPEYSFLRRQVRWSGIPISFRVVHSLLWSTLSKALVNETEVDVFLKFPCFLYNPVNVGSLISSSSSFSKPGLDIWKFLHNALHNAEAYSAVCCA